MLTFFLIVFIVFEIIQTWFILFEKNIFRGVKGVAIAELIESPLMIFLILQGNPQIILLIVSIEIIQWILVAFLFNFLD
ncbi:MAG: hypothetical protein HY443_00890 [Candidatus Nealsonbacteria bacterium]|nr:hypothetical protein [Candidatus Nealsonbacteria bacterium]